MKKGVYSRNDPAPQGQKQITSFFTLAAATSNMASASTNENLDNGREKRSASIASAAADDKAKRAKRLAEEDAKPTAKPIAKPTAASAAAAVNDSDEPPLLLCGKHDPFTETIQRKTVFLKAGELYDPTQHGEDLLKYVIEEFFPKLPDVEGYEIVVDVGVAYGGTDTIGQLRVLGRINKHVMPGCSDMFGKEVGNGRVGHFHSLYIDIHVECGTNADAAHGETVLSNHFRNNQDREGYIVYNIPQNDGLGATITTYATLGGRQVGHYSLYGMCLLYSRL